MAENVKERVGDVADEAVRGLTAVPGGNRPRAPGAGDGHRQHLDDGVSRLVRRITDREHPREGSGPHRQAGRPREDSRPAGRSPRRPAP